MKLLQLYTFLLTACLLSNTALAVQSGADRPAQQADSLFDTGNYYPAAILYQKAAFLSTNNADQLRFTINAANCYKLMARFEEAIDLLSAFPTTDLNDSLVAELKSQVALVAYLKKDFNLAESYLVQLAYQVKDSARIYGSYLLYALILNEQFRWEEAKQKLTQLNNFINSAHAMEKKAKQTLLDSLYNPNNLPRIKNPVKATKLSTFFPGAGQMYAGYAGEGLFSFAAIGVLASGMVLGVVYQYYFSSVFLGNILIGKFYQGGIKRAEFLAQKRNYIRTKTFNFGIKGRLIKEFT